MKPTVICHRGWWKTKEEQNTLPAFACAFDRGWGVELDVRDCGGELVVSHDPPVGGRLIRFEQVLDLLWDRPNVLAVNVKSCGLAPWFAKLAAPKNWFFFDVAFYDSLEYGRLGLCQGKLIRSPELFGNPHLPGWEILKSSFVPDGTCLLTDFPEQAEEFFK